MLIFLVVLLLIWIVYTAILTYLYRSWNFGLLNLRKQTNTKQFSGVSLLIVARNEEAHVDQLFESISKQLLDKSLFEVIFIDDSSEDRTIELANLAVEKYSLNNLKIISLAELPNNSLSGKKDGLSHGISLTTFPLVALSDADCFLPAQWLTKIRDNYLRSGANVVCGPVLVTAPTNTIGRLQEIDFAVTAIINSGAAAGKLFFLGNAANMAFEKEVFNEVGGYNADQKASGDDVLLLQKIAELSPDNIYYHPNKDSAIYTHPVFTNAEFYEQRLRWASKNDMYRNKFLNLTQITVYLTNLSQLILGVWLVLFPFITVPLAVPALLLVKVSIDYFIATNALRYYNKKSIGIPEFIQINFQYAFYIAYVATKSIFIKQYSWKGRKVE